MKKHILDLQVVACERLHERYVLLRLTNAEAPLPPMVPGQFVQVRIDGSAGTFLRRPISIHFVDYGKNELHLLVQVVGDGTRWLSTLKEGDLLNVVLPLGNGFSLPTDADEKPLLIGGGVGIAPLLWLGSCLKEKGITPTFLLGARSKGDLLRLNKFEEYGPVYVTTEDGTAGERGFVTQHSVLQAQKPSHGYMDNASTSVKFNSIDCCGPKPMMMAVAKYARQHGIPCEVSLENMMACGLGACLCCVEDTQRGNVCVCTEGPVFNIDDLKWELG